MVRNNALRACGALLSAASLRAARAMFAFRNHQSFMETITNNVLEDLRTLLNPCWCRVKGLFAPRGGTRIHVFAETFKDGMLFCCVGLKPGASQPGCLAEPLPTRPT